MIALGPRDIARAVAFSLAVVATFHFIDRIIAGFARCPIERCLPW